MITVQELIGILAGYPPDAEVRVSQHHYFGVWDIGIEEDDIVAHPDVVMLDVGQDECKVPLGDS